MIFTSFLIIPQCVMHYIFILYAYLATTAGVREDTYRLLSGLDHRIWKSSGTRRWNLVRQFMFIPFVQL